MTLPQHIFRSSLFSLMDVFWSLEHGDEERGGEKNCETGKKIRNFWSGFGNFLKYSKVVEQYISNILNQFLIFFSILSYNSCFESKLKIQNSVQGVHRTTRKICFRIREGTVDELQIISKMRIDWFRQEKKKKNFS